MALDLGRPVDLVALKRAPADLVHRVLRDGVLVFDASARVFPRRMQVPVTFVSADVRQLAAAAREGLAPGSLD
jgi:hypothetical protein